MTSGIMSKHEERVWRASGAVIITAVVAAAVIALA